MISLDPFAQQRVLHRRIHSDPSFSFQKQSIGVGRLRVASPPPLAMNDENNSIRQANIPSISYVQSEECGSYGSSYDSRADMYDQNKQTKLTLGQSTNLDNDSRQLMSSQITLIDEQNNNLYSSQLSSIVNNGETLLSVNSTSPTDQSITTSTNDYPTRGNFLHCSRG